MYKAKSKKLSSNMEDYLESIVILKKRNKVARVKDIGRLMEVKTSSVTSALNTLSEKRLVLHERYGYVELTPKGKRLAEAVLNKHNMLFAFLTEILGIQPQIAQEDACKIEHSVSPQTFKKISKFIDFVKSCPNQDRPDWLKSFDYYFRTGKRPKCKTRLIKQETNK